MYDRRETHEYDRRESHNMWRELRSWPLYVQIGVGAAALAAVVLAFVIPLIAGPAYPDESEWPEGELPEASGSIEPAEGPEEEDSLPEGVSTYDGEPLWTHQLDTDSGSVTQLDQGTLVRTGDSLRLIADEATVWEHTWEDFSPEIGVAGDVVVITGGAIEGAPWPGRKETIALDLDTGDEVWSNEDASFVTVFSDAVLMSECGGDQEGNIGDCTLYARDPADLSTLWSEPTYASVQAVSPSSWTGEPLPEQLIVESFPHGLEDRTVSVLEDGGEVASVQTDDSVVLEDRMMIVYDDYDDNPADGCTASVAGYRFGEDDPAWELEADMRKSADLSSCGELPNTAPRDGMLPLTIDGAPALVDLETGEAVWTGSGEGQAYTISEDAGTLIAADWESEEDNLIAYDVDSGEELWRATAGVEDSTQATAVGSTLWLYGSGSMWGWSSSGVVAYDLGTGEGFALPGSISTFAPGEVVMTDGDYETPTLTAWPVDLWAEE